MAVPCLTLWAKHTSLLFSFQTLLGILSVLEIFNTIGSKKAWVHGTRILMVIIRMRNRYAALQIGNRSWHWCRG